MGEGRFSKQFNNLGGEVLGEGRRLVLSRYYFLEFILFFSFFGENLRYFRSAQVFPKPLSAARSGTPRTPGIL